MLWLWLGKIFIPVFFLLSFHQMGFLASLQVEKALSDVWITFTINNACSSWWTMFLIVVCFLKVEFALNLEISDCLTVLSKREWFQKGNTAFCSFRQHPSSPISQSTGCLGTLTVTHVHVSFSVTILLNLGRRRKAPQERKWQRVVGHDSCSFGTSSDTVGFLQSNAVMLSCYNS